MKKFYFLLTAVALTLSINAQNAFLLLENAISNLPEEYSETEDAPIAENPEQNAANWFNAQYVTKGIGSFISTGEIAGAFEAGIKTIWVNVDRVGLADIRNAGLTDGVVSDLKAFVQAGGNLLLTKQATMVAHRIGRIYAPNFENGGYNLGNDVWAINPQLGLNPDAGGVVDRSDHPIYEDVEWDNTLYKYTVAIDEETSEEYYYNVLPLVGAVPRTDNNCMWVDLFRKDPENPTEKLVETEETIEQDITHYANLDHRRIEDFEADWNCHMLACWGHVTDFCSAGIVEMFPEGEFQGTVMGIGFAAYQWGNSNDYIANVKKLTKNTLNYLTGEITPEGIEEVMAAKGAKGIYNLLGQKVSDMVPGQIYIVNGQRIILR